MSTQPLTEAERAVLAAMMSNPSPNECWCDWVAGDPPCDECSRAARAVVAAVRGPLYRDAADQIRKDWPKSPFVAQKLEKLAEAAEGHGDDWTDWQDGDDGPSCKCGFNGTPQECASSRNRARQSLSRPTSEEHQ